MENQIEALLEKLVTEKVNDMDFEQVARDQTRQFIREQMLSVVRDLIRNEGAAIVSEEIKKFMAAPILTDDGWGNKKQWASFEELFKREFSLQIKGNYNLSSHVERIVKEETSKLLTSRRDEIARKLADELTAPK